MSCFFYLCIEIVTALWDPSAYFVFQITPNPIASTWYWWLLQGIPSDTIISWCQRTICRLHCFRGIVFHSAVRVYCMAKSWTFFTQYCRHGHLIKHSTINLWPNRTISCILAVNPFEIEQLMSANNEHASNESSASSSDLSRFLLTRCFSTVAITATTAKIAKLYPFYYSFFLRIVENDGINNTKNEDMEQKIDDSMFFYYC